MGIGNHGQGNDAEHALGLPTLYASGRAGIASTTQPANGENPEGENLDPLFDVLMEHIPAPVGDPEAPLQALVTNLDASAFLGRLALVRIYKGRLKKGQQAASSLGNGSGSADNEMTLAHLSELYDEDPDAAGKLFNKMARAGRLG